MMISANNRDNITKLIRKIANEVSTEELLTFFADNDGMFESCEILKNYQEQNNHQVRQWFDKECLINGITHHQFNNYIAPVLASFTIDSLEDAYATLGIKRHANIKEIKQAYRNLSRQYHPDTTKTNREEAVKQFIVLSTAYKKIITTVPSKSSNASSPPPAWKYKYEIPIDKRGIKNTILVISSLCIILLFLTFISPFIHRNIFLFKTTDLYSSTDTSKTKKSNSGQSTIRSIPHLMPLDKSNIESVHIPEQKITKETPSIPTINSQPVVLGTDITNNNITKKLDQQLITEKSLHKFLENYIFLYNNKDLTGLSKLFELDAEENGSPFKDMTTSYTKFFDSSKSLALNISIISWKHTGNTINLIGDFHIFLHYPDSTSAQLRGNISFILNNDRNSYKIKRLSYSFQK